MNTREHLVKKCFDALGVMACELKTARSYGTAHTLSDSDMGLLTCVERNEGAKACELSKYLGITCGAVTQLAKKLVGKGYLESYQIPGNRKEVYYRLTGEGETACRGHDRHFGRIRENIERYAEKLDDETIGKIIGLMDAIAGGAEVCDECSIKLGLAKEKNEETTAGRCEKCRRIY